MDNTQHSDIIKRMLEGRKKFVIMFVIGIY